MFVFVFQIEMAHKVLSADMAELINAMKLAQKYSTTTLDQEYRRGMLSAGHVLAVDAKHLFDVVDTARRLKTSLHIDNWLEMSTEGNVYMEEADIHYSIVCGNYYHGILHWCPCSRDLPRSDTFGQCHRGKFFKLLYFYGSGIV